MKRSIDKRCIKITIILFLCTIFILSCNTRNSKTADTAIGDVDINNYCMEVTNGYIDSIMNKLSDITPYKTAEATDEFDTAPCIYLSKDKTYLIRNFPADLMDGAEAMYDFIENNNIIKKIEVYLNYDYSDVSEEIILWDIQERKIVFYNLYYDTDSECFYIIGNENENDKYIVKIFEFNKSGDLLREQKLPVLSIYNVIMCSSGCYEIRPETHDQDTFYYLIKFDLDTLLESNLDESIITAFVSNDELYYIKAESSGDINDITSLYQYNIDNGITFIDNLYIYKRILTASYDQLNNGVFFSDYSNLYYYKNGDITKVLSVTNSYIDIKLYSDQKILLGIGHNQLSLYYLNTDIVGVSDD